MCKTVVAQAPYPHTVMGDNRGVPTDKALCSGLLAVLGIKLSLMHAGKALCHGATAPPCGCLRISLFTEPGLALNSCASQSQLLELRAWSPLLPVFMCTAALVLIPEHWIKNQTQSFLYLARPLNSNSICFV